MANRLNTDQTLILVNTFPIINKNPLRTNQGIFKVENISFKKIDRTRNKQIIDSLVSNNTNIKILDLSKSEIYNDIPYLKDTLIYYDANHLNKRGAIELGKELENKILETLDLNRK